MNKKLYGGFTLIELLIVMAIAAILSFVIVAVSFDQIKFASDTVAQQDLSLYGRANESYATSHNGFYPATLLDLFGVNEISKIPSPPEGYAYTMTAYPSGCTGGVSCTSIIITSPLKSARFITTPFFRYESTTGRTCKTANPNTPCP